MTRGVLAALVLGAVACTVAPAACIKGSLDSPPRDQVSASSGSGWDECERDHCVCPGYCDSDGGEGGGTVVGSTGVGGLGGSNPNAGGASGRANAGGASGRGGAGGA